MDEERTVEDAAFYLGHQLPAVDCFKEGEALKESGDEAAVDALDGPADGRVVADEIGVGGVFEHQLVEAVEPVGRVLRGIV